MVSMSVFRFLLCISIFGIVFYCSGEERESLSLQAGTYFSRGLASTEPAVRKELLNKALTIFLSLEKSRPSPFLEGAVGDSYYQLGEYAWAILYYNRALQKDPENKIVRERLLSAQSALGILPESTQDSYGYFERFFMRIDTSRLFALLGILFFFCLSGSIWFPNRFWIALSYGIGACIVFLSIYAVLRFYFIPVEAIAIEPTGIYRRPDKEESQVVYDPLFKGVKVIVLDVDPSGQWLKIETSGKMIGYVPFYSLRIINSE